MKKVILLILVSILLLVAFTSCAKITGLKDKLLGKKECAHEWTEATCNTPKTCNLCGATDGAPSNKHKTVAPTCTTPEMCSVCGKTSEYWRAALDHDWAEASCLKGTAKTCRRCGLVEGEIPEHVWTEATCLDDSKCEVCNFPNDGSALGHNIVTVARVEPTCTEAGATEGEACTRCGYSEKGKAPQPIAPLEHKDSEVDIEGTPATCTTDGLTPGKKCGKCGVITDPQLPIPAKGHQRYLFDEEGNVTEEHLVPEKYVAPTCQTEGREVYKCYACEAEIEVTLAVVHHKYPDGATCGDADAKCKYCEKPIEHEFADPTCTDAATCIICGEIDADRPALAHKGYMSEATCLAPATCSLCGHTEGEKLVHELTTGLDGIRIMYVCSKCDTSFTPLDEYYYLDGTTYDNMQPVNNSITGYDTYVDENGTVTNYPIIKADENGNRYYSLIRTKEPEIDKSTGKPYSPQIQLWVPMMRNGFAGFNSANSSVGFLSFRINACMDKNFSLSFLEGGGWADTDAIKDFFILTPPTTDEATGRTYVRFMSIDTGDDNQLVLFEKDVTDANSVADMFTGWHDIYIGIVLDDATDTINLHYYIDGQYKGSKTKALLTANNGFKCIYVSGNTFTMGGGLMIDDIAFGYTAYGDWPFDVYHEHSYTNVAEEVEATCTSDGYKIYSCSCGAAGARVTTPALGHIVHTVEAKAATCTEDGNNAYSYCTREDCGAELVKKEIYPAAGHDYATVREKLPDCINGGYINQRCNVCKESNKVTLEPLGHVYPLNVNCEQSTDCTRCGETSQGAIRHQFAPATCTLPATCMRDGCTVTEGEALGHVFADPTCTKAATCTRCDHTEGEKLSHALEYKYAKSTLTYYCATCTATYNVSGQYYYLNGTDHKNMLGVDTNAKNYTVASGSYNPAIVDGHYELLNTTGNKGQIQVWLPVNDNSTDLGFSSANRAVGVFSIKINANITNNFDIKFVDGLSNPNASDRWRPGGVAGGLKFDISEAGVLKLQIGVMDPDGGQGAYLIKRDIARVTLGDDNFTGWMDITIGMVLDPDTDQITYHCYFGGAYVTSFSTELTTKTNSINCVYMVGNTTTKGSGIMFDDVVFGYVPNGEWVFDSCNHEGTTETVLPTCTTDGYDIFTCTKCDYINYNNPVPAFGHTEEKAPDCTHGSLCATCGEYYGEALGHTGGQATCTEKPVCDRCGESYGSTQHDIVAATCSASAYCQACSEVFGDPTSHNPVPTVIGTSLAYACKYCEYTWKLSDSFFHTADTDTPDAPYLDTLDERNVFNNPANQDANIVVKGEGENADKYYEFVHGSESISDRKLEKATVWTPKASGNAYGFNSFTMSGNTLGVFSIDLNVYVEGVSGTNAFLEMRFVDTDCRTGGPNESSNFWSEGANEVFFNVSAPDENNVVTLTGFNCELAKIQVTDEDKYTGWFNLTVGMEFDSVNKKLILHYYLNGVYKCSASQNMRIVTGKIDGVFISATTNVEGSGYKFDNLGFGCAKPNVEGNLPPYQTKEEK